MGLLEKIRGAFGAASPEPLTAGSGIPEPQASVGSAYEGADRMNLELARWNPPSLSADGEILPVKETLDARGRDLARNDPLVANAVELHRNGVVGTKFILNSKPSARLLGPGFDERAIDAVQEEVEALFDVYAHSDQNHVDAARKMNLTDIVRLGTGATVVTGEFLATFEWLEDRKFRTAVQVVDVDRLSNPDYAMDTLGLRGGVELDRFGAPVAYHIRTAHPSDYYGMGGDLSWKRVPARKPWGRPMVMHVFDAMRADQTRGVAKMVSALRQMKMTAKFSDVALQNAVIQASIAATIESERGPAEVYEQLGADGALNGSFSEHLNEFATTYLNEAMAYGRSGNVARLNGAMIPHLFPGTKLNIKALGDGTLGTGFESSLIRKIAAGLGVSHEELSKNLSETSFAGVKAAMAQTFQTMQAVKRSTADRIATSIYRNWLEEVVDAGLITSLPNSAKRRGWILQGCNLDALSACSWIGAARGTIDEYNEVRAAEKRYGMGLTTMEFECARLGLDWRDVQKQRRREAQYLGGPVGAPASGPESGASAKESAEERLAAVEDFVEAAQNDR